MELLVTRIALLLLCFCSVQGQPACGNFKAYGFCKFGANCKFDHSMPLNPYNNTGLIMPSLPTAYASPVTNHLRSSPPTNRSDSTTLSNGKPVEENESSETEKQDDSPAQPDKSEVKDSSPPSHSDSTAPSNGKPDAENTSTETEKQDEKPAQPENSEVHVDTSS